MDKHIECILGKSSVTSVFISTYLLTYILAIKDRTTVLPNTAVFYTVYTMAQNPLYHPALVRADYRASQRWNVVVGESDVFVTEL